MSGVSGGSVVRLRLPNQRAAWPRRGGAIGCSMNILFYRRYRTRQGLLHICWKYLGKVCSLTAALRDMVTASQPNLLALSCVCSQCSAHSFINVWRTVTCLGNTAHPPLAVTFSVLFAITAFWECSLADCSVQCSALENSSSMMSVVPVEKPQLQCHECAAGESGVQPKVYSRTMII